MFWIGAAVSLCYVPGITGAYIATQWPLLGVVLSALFLHDYVARQWPKLALWPPRTGPFTSFHAAGLLFVAYAVAGVFFISPLRDVSVQGAWFIIIMAACVWFGTTLEDTRELYAGLAAGGIVSTLAAVSQVSGYQLFPVTSGHYAGMYVNAVQQGTVLALVIVALVSQRMWRWALPLMPGVILAQSRGGWVVLAAGLLACYMRRLWVFGIFGVIGAVYLFTSVANSDVERLFIWKAAWDNLVPYGQGPGIFYALMLSGKYGIFFPEYAHNDALQFAFEYGVAAVIPIAIVGYALSRTDMREWPVIVALATASCFSMPLFMPIASFLGLVAVGRVLRSYGLDGGNRRGSGRDFVAGYGRRITGARRKVVPVQPNFANEG